MSNIQEQIKDLVTENKIVVFMKGTPEQPMCGFSAKVAEVMHNLETPFMGVNVLLNDEVREGIKEFSDWPTIPQLYVDGTFVGGCDIVTEMFQNGELENLINKTA